MKRVYVLVEGETDAEFLRRLLPPEVTSDAEIVAAGSSSEIPSLARSLLVRRQRPVAVLMDADSLSESMIQERKESTEDLIQSAAVSIPVKVFVVVPEIESWFFAIPEAINRIFGQETPQDLVVLGRRDPKGVLHQLEERSKQKWKTGEAIRQLDSQDIEKLRRLPEVTELSKFLEEVQKDDKAA